jgi:transcriptional regulator with XRE-family HTH domain
MPQARLSARTGRRPTTDLAQEPVAEPITATSAAANPNVGHRLRELRTERDLSLRALAKRSGLNVNTLSLIENNKTSPSVSTLRQIAAALDIPIVAFFETDAPRNSVAYIKADHRPRTAFAHGTLEDLGAGLTERVVEPFIVVLEPNADSGPQPIVHTGYEFVFCLRGHLIYSIEERTYMLGPGDSLVFESHLPHSWRNADAAPSQAVLVLCPTDARDRPTERHFTPKEAGASP